MLHDIDDQGNISYHCANPECRLHNCQGWDNGVFCEAHGEAQRAQPAGETQQRHISDPGVRWSGKNEIELPTCECGWQVTSLRVHTDEECTPPTIKRDEQTGKILQIIHPAGRAPWLRDSEVHHLAVPHPTLAHLPSEKIQELQRHIRSLAPTAPTDWMLSIHIYEDIKDVLPHPAIARHRELARQMEAIGKKRPSGEQLRELVREMQAKGKMPSGEALTEDQDDQ